MNYAVSHHYTKGQRVEILWDRLGWLPGTFLGYPPAEDGEDFQRLHVRTDSGRVCVSPGAHPDCVRAEQVEAVSHFSSRRTNPTHTAPHAAHGAPVALSAQSGSAGRSVQAGSYA